MAGESTGGDQSSRANSTKVSVLGAGSQEPDKNAAVLSLPPPRWVRRRRRWLVAIGTVLLAVGSLLAAAVFSPMLALDEISVEGNELVSDEVIIQSLDPLIGTPLPQVSEAEVRARLSDLPQVEDVSIQARPPSSMVIQVQERLPVALLKDGENFVLIDASGVQLATVPDRQDAELPLIDGGSEQLGADIFEAITGVLAALPADILARLQHASAESIDSVELTLTNDKRVLWGNATQKDLKSEVLQVMLDAQPQPSSQEDDDAGDGAGEDAENAVEVYDVSTPTRPVTR